MFERKRIDDLLTRECPFSGVADLNLRMGYIRAYHDGYQWWNTIFPCNRQLETPKRIAELDTLYRMFFEQVSNLDALRGFCRKAALPSGDPDEYSAYCQTDHGIYRFRFILCKGDYNLYLEAFDPAVAQ